MRVLETKSPGPSSMVKRKHKLRKQSSKSVEVAASDSSDEGGDQTTADHKCRHISKAVNINTVRKTLKQTSVGECTDCVKAGPSSSNRGTEGAVGGVGQPGEDQQGETTIWVCLQCGHQGCDRNSKEKHALKHYQTPRSNSHALVVNLTTWIIWCYDCDEEVLAEENAKLADCVEAVRKQIGGVRPDTVDAPTHAALSRQSSRNEACVSSESTVDVLTSKEEKAHPKEVVMSAFPSGYLPKVKGLSNLGNTCFFNAVMQNLSQTPLLDSVITEQGKRGATMSLPGTASDCEDSDSSSSSSSENEEKKEKVHLEPLTISLSESTGLMASVSGFLKDMTSPSKSSVVTPSGLFGQVCRKAPRFKGFQQQDSHELLRHLLDGMKAEEIKRCQSGILKAFQLPESIKAHKVDEEKKLKIKEYGRRAKYTFVDKLFGGLFISTVLCEECKIPSQILEPFLDISLPITEEKPQRPNKKDSKIGSKEKVVEEKAEDDGYPKYRTGPSKHQLKKQSKKAKKEAKRKGRGTRSKGQKLAESTSQNDLEKEGASEEEEDKDGGGSDAEDEERLVDKDAGLEAGPQASAEQLAGTADDGVSDADVEDNLDTEMNKSKNKFSLPASMDHPVDTNMALSLNGHVIHNGVSADNFSESSASAGNSLQDCDLEQCNEKGKEDSVNENTVMPGVNVNGFLSSNEHSGWGAASLGNSSKCTGHNYINGDIENVTAGVSSLTVISHNGCIAEDTGYSSSKLFDTNSTLTCSSAKLADSNSFIGSKSSQDCSDRTAENIEKSRKEIWMEAAVKALNTLAPRYQPAALECSVQSCLHQFTSAELLTGQNKFGCGYCSRRKRNGEGKRETVYTNASKQVLIFSPPAILTLHLKRFQQVGFSLRKVNRFVDFPLVLDLAPYCSSLSQSTSGSQGKVLYSLYGIVEHAGRLNGGHYTAYVKVRPSSNKEQIQQFVQHLDISSLKMSRLIEKLHRERLACMETNADENNRDASAAPLPGKWFYISDTRVSDANEQNVLRCQAYILFYERIA